MPTLKELQTRLAPPDKAIETYFVTDKDKKSIEDFTRGNTGTKYTISFRPAGQHSVARLKAGAGAKPHDILEKSVKLPHNAFEHGRALTEKEQLENIAYYKKLSLVSGTEDQEKCRKVFEILKGYVGRYDSKGKLLGIYLTTMGYQTLMERGEPYSSSIICVNNKAKVKRYFLKLTRQDGCRYDRLPELSPSWQQYFFTGDYDTHDAMQLVSGWNILIEGTSDYEDRYKPRLIEALRIENCPTVAPEDYNRVQHGAQIGFLAFMLNTELIEVLLQKPIAGQLTIARNVAHYDFPIAFCSEGQWALVRRMEEYVDYYEAMGLTPKWIWESETTFKNYLEEMDRVYCGMIRFK